VPGTTSSNSTPAMGAADRVTDQQVPPDGDPVTAPKTVKIPMAMEEGAPADAAGETAQNSQQAGSTWRWWLAVAVGVVVSLPFAWLLSYAALLPFFIGLFFFALFGLVIGAAIHRIASPRRPYGRFALVVGTTLVVGVGWVTSVVKESRDFPSDMAVKAGNETRSIGDRTIEAYRTAVADDIRRFLRERYPPGDTLGYVRWVLTSGELKKGEIADVNRTLQPLQRRFTWAARIVLSIALFAFGVGSQTFLLSKVTERSVRARDNVEQPDST